MKIVQYLLSAATLIIILSSCGGENSETGNDIEDTTAMPMPMQDIPADTSAVMPDTVNGIDTTIRTQPTAGSANQMGVKDAGIGTN